MTELTMQPLETTKNRYAQFVEFSKEIMKDKLDYWIIPGVSKPSLFKPWAEKLRLVYGLQVFIEKTGETLDIDRDFYDVNYMATVKDKNGLVLGMCEWSCNTMEDRYNFSSWKDVSKPMKDWKQDDLEIERLKAEGLGKRKRGNSGWIWQQREQVKSWKLTHKNTIQKMAQKRAYVGVILNATWASEFYTQDVEDMNIGNAEVIEIKEEKNQTSAPVQTQSSSPQATEKPWFNKPQLEELSQKKNFINSFNSGDDLIAEVEKTYRISWMMKDEIKGLWCDIYTPYKASEETEEQKKADCDLPF